MDINSKVNPNLHPDKIAGDSQSAKSARHALEALYVAEGKIRDLYDVVKGKALMRQKLAMASMPKPPDGKRKLVPALIYDEQAATHIIEVGVPLAQVALKVVDTSIAVLNETAGRLDVAIHQKVTAAKNPTRGPELRAWASTQDFTKLGAMFQSADKNPVLVAEVLGAEYFLSGITQENQAHLRTVAEGVLAPDEVQARVETSAALEHLTAAHKSFTAMAADIFNGLQSPTAGVIDSIVKGDE